MKNLYALRMVSLVALLMLIAGCGSRKKGDSYHLTTPVVDARKGFSTQMGQVTVIADAYDTEQCRDYFGVDLLAYNIQPVVFEVQNNTPEEIEFRGSYIELDLLSADEVARALHYNTWVWAASALGIGWQLFAPLMFYTPFMVYMMHKSNSHITSAVANVTYDGSQPVLVFEPYTRNHFMICTRKETFKHIFGLRFFVPEQKKLINLMMTLKPNAA